MEKSQQKTIIIIIAALIIVVLLLAVLAPRLGIFKKGGKGGGGGSGGGEEEEEEIPNFPIFTDRSEWETIIVDGAKCGNGEPYQILFSQGPSLNNKPNNRLVIWFPGGGSTSKNIDGTLNTAIGSLKEMRALTSPKRGGPLEIEQFIFIDHPDNELFVKDANWVTIPYCTQDFHSGRETSAKRYDFSEVTKIVQEIETLLNNRGNTIQEIQSQIKGLEIQGTNINGRFEVEKVYFNILHDGAKNVELGLDKVFERLQPTGFNLNNAEILMTGSSAGGFGVWYNAWRIGDLIYNKPNAKFTIIPQAGSPTARVWDGNDIVTNAQKKADLQNRLDNYNVLQPCEQNGATYSGGDECLDVLDLTEHYHSRFGNLDLRILPVINKEDLIAVSGLGDQNAPEFPAKLLALCQTIHRYAQYGNKEQDTFVWTDWLFIKKGTGDLKRVHGFKGPAETTEMISPNNGQSSYTLIGFINDVAARKIEWGQTSVHIENTAKVITQPNNLNSPVSAQSDYNQECNVPNPARNRPQ